MPTSDVAHLLKRSSAGWNRHSGKTVQSSFSGGATNLSELGNYFMGGGSGNQFASVSWYYRASQSNILIATDDWKSMYFEYIFEYIFKYTF